MIDENCYLVERDKQNEHKDKNIIDQSIGIFIFGNVQIKTIWVK